MVLYKFCLYLLQPELDEDKISGEFFIVVFIITKTMYVTMVHKGYVNCEPY